jgi:hypothetical protein
MDLTPITPHARASRPETEFEMAPRDEIEQVMPARPLEEPTTTTSDDTVRSAVGERLRTERLRLERECEALRAKITRLSGVARSRPR